jgi:DNA-binding GntR family transcriptional regulator
MQLIDRNANQKLYFQLYEIFKKKIESNEWLVGSMIPTEEELCKMFDVSRATVRTSVLELVRHGYLKRQPGRGTFVLRNDISDGLSMFTNFSEFLLEKDTQFSTNILAQTVMMPIDDLEIRLDIPKDKHVIYIKRLHSIDERPVLLQETYVPYHICPLLLEETLESHSILTLFEKKYGLQVTRAKNYIEITFLNSEEARLLRMNEGVAAVLLNQYFYSGDTRVLYTRSIKRTDSNNFLMEFESKTI